MITALGTGIGPGEFDLGKLRYHRVIVMTDADVDGAHIRTLLLTFFFRQMPELVQAGHLYIAQPPLYKAKKGKGKAIYLKDDKALTDYLFERGARELMVEAGKGEKIEGEDLLKFLSSLRSYKSLLTKVARRFDERVVQAFVDCYEGKTADIVRDKAAMDTLLAELKSTLEARFRPDDLRLTQLELQHSAEVDAFEIHCSTRQGGVERRTHIGWDLLHAGDFRKVQSLHAEANAMGRAPYRLVRQRGEPLDFDSNMALYNHVDSESRKGYDIQRYKGLGEMNPEQLWETTMDPTVRTLVQVRVDDLVEADEIFTLLMGDEVEPRRNFIQTNALNVQNLDV